MILSALNVLAYALQLKNAIFLFFWFILFLVSSIYKLIE